MMTDTASLSGTLWLNKDTHNYLGSKRIALLEQIEQTGSLTKAAKLAGMSYKSAWDALTTMNNLADQPLTHAATGGRDGGGTQLTEAGSRAVQLYRTIEAEHARVLEKLSDKYADYDQLVVLLQRLAMRTSARNNLRGKVVDIDMRGLLTSLQIQLPSGLIIESVITSDSAFSLVIQKGQQVFALIKAPCMVLAPKPLSGYDNILPGTVVKMTQDDSMIELELELAGGEQLSAVVEKKTLEGCDLSIGAQMVAHVAASQVLIGVE
jgi:molybdate transport system regulatory protein